jgi:ketosteroid isomerase-like protein
VKRLPLVLAALLAPSLATAAPRADVAEVVAAERAFAAAARADGAHAAFLRYSAPDALVFQPGPRLAKAALEAKPLPAVPLDWWPAYAGIAASGDLGFTTGPFVVGKGERPGHGWYFTIWRRQPDGSWRWIVDHGPRTREAAPEGTGARVATLPAGRRAPAADADAFGDVKSVEARLAAALAADARAALPRFLAADGRIIRAGPQPAVGAAAWKPLLASGPGRIDTAPLGGAASAAGDLAFTYGTARWRSDKGEAEGHYVRIWQRRREGWKLIVDNMIAVPPSHPEQPSAGG